MKVIAIVAASLLTLAVPMSATASSTVPCKVFNTFRGYVRSDSCVNPFLSGVVDGQWVGVVMKFSGGNGGALSAHVYASGHGGNGDVTVDLGEIDAVSEYQGADPDGLQVIFRRGKLWAVNKLAHDLWKDFIVRQYGFHDQKLRVEKWAKFTYDRKAWSESDFEAAAESALGTTQ